MLVLEIDQTASVYAVMLIRYVVKLPLRHPRERTGLCAPGRYNPRVSAGIDMSLSEG